MAKPKGQKVQITERALIQRINRKLAKDMEQLKTARTESVERDVGKYFVLDLHRNAIIQTNVDPEELGRKIEVLQAWEEVASGD
jgi:hypothetical protein